MGPEGNANKTSRETIKIRPATLVKLHYYRGKRAFSYCPVYVCFKHYGESVEVDNNCASYLMA